MELRLNRYQENLWKYANLYPAEFYNLGLSFCLSPKLRPDLLKRAFEYVLNSTEVLSAVLVSDDDFGTCFETENKAPFIFECWTRHWMRVGRIWSILLVNRLTYRVNGLFE